MIWDLATGKIRSRLSGLPEDDAVISLAFSPDRRSLAAATTDKETVFSLDGKVIRSGNGSTISDWEFTNGRELSLKRRITGIIGVVWAWHSRPTERPLRRRPRRGKFGSGTFRQARSVRLSGAIGKPSMVSLSHSTASCLRAGASTRQSNFGTFPRARKWRRSAVTRAL